MPRLMPRLVPHLLPLPMAKTTAGKKGGIGAYLHALPAAIAALPPAPATPIYQGRDPYTGHTHSLPRTPAAEALARHLVSPLPCDGEGKMYGVLIVRTATGEIGYLRAFSGQMRGQGHHPGWVPPLPGRERASLAEALTLNQLAAIQRRLEDLQQWPLWHTHPAQVARWQAQRDALNTQHRQRRQQRHHQRQQLSLTLTGPDLAQALHSLDQASRADKAELRRFKAERARHLAPLETALAAAQAEVAALKRQRQQLSRQLQTTLHQVYTLTNFAGASVGLHALGTALPTGTGDCCAPKLLHFAATHTLRPLALAEIWAGAATADRQPGKFYGACRERCQPIMGFLLAGLPDPAPPPTIPTPLPPQTSLDLLYIDPWLVAVTKPPGLLSVPGRQGTTQDSVLYRLQHQLGSNLWVVHRLDQATSGVLVLARDGASQRHLQRQFAQRQVEKRYRALLSRAPARWAGTIELPLGADPHQRPRQRVDWTQGKPSQTQFRVHPDPVTVPDRDSSNGNYPNQARLPRQPIYGADLVPLTGRTHQLRVHAAHPQGLNAPILGDALYGEGEGAAARLYLHAVSLQFSHPHHGQPVHLYSPAPF